MISPNGPQLLVLWDIDHTLLQSRGMGREMYERAFPAAFGQPFQQLADVSGRTELDIIAETLKLSAIVTYTASGTTGLRAARERPQVPIVALSPIVDTARRLSLLWGTHCVVSPDAQNLDDMVDRACRIAFSEKFSSPGDRIIITAGVPLRTPGSTNMLRIAYVGPEGRGGR